MSVDGATDTAVLQVYVQQVLVPMLVSCVIFVPDKLATHKISGIRKALEAAGAKLLDLRFTRRIARPLQAAGPGSKAAGDKPGPAHRLRPSPQASH